MRLSGLTAQNTSLRISSRSQTYQNIVANEALSVGTVLRIRAYAPGELAVRGTVGAAASVTCRGK